VAQPYPFLFRVLHWLLTASVVVLILTGFSLHAGSRPEWSLLDGKVPSWLWTGRVHYWHAWASLLFVPAILGACWVYMSRRRHLRPTHLWLLLGGVIAAISGVFLANPVQSASCHTLALWSHFLVGAVVIPLAFLWHGYTGFTRYVRSLVPSFHPWAQPGVVSLVVLLVVAVGTSCLLLNGWPFRYTWRDLHAPRIEAPLSVDLKSLPWDESQPLHVQLANGSSMDEGRTLLTLRALHDGSQLYLRAQWADNDEDYDYWPWRRTETGWRYLQTSPKDECHCYEDKFSLIFPIQPDGDFERFACAASCHVHKDYGWGYKGTSRLIDVWHWKAARTGSVGQVDDKYWAEADFESKDIGRHGDPKEGGGYTKNRTDDVDHPPFLPDSLDAIYHGSFPKERAVPYTAEAGEAIAVNQLIPGVVTEAFIGDRGNVNCVSHYADGTWTLYIRRQLETGSDYDVQFSPGGCYAFGCAAFDHAGKRHAYALPTFHLVLAP
jgi:hypothetical protein